MKTLQIKNSIRVCPHCKNLQSQQSANATRVGAALGEPLFCQDHAPPAGARKTRCTACGALLPAHYSHCQLY